MGVASQDGVVQFFKQRAKYENCQSSSFNKETKTSCLHIHIDQQNINDYLTKTFAASFKFLVPICANFGTILPNLCN